jgi:2-polyprenyl-6-methoxyphenol hydroxylase-like FAD-dependent oxidoreductase
LPDPYYPPVAIVGGGIAGLALGRALQERSIPFRLLERRQTPADGGLAIILPGNAIAALGVLGLRERVEKSGRPLRRRQYRNSADRMLCEIDEDAFWGAANRPRSVMRSDLLDMLGSGLPQDAISLGTEVRTLGIHDDRTELGLTGGAVLDARLVVGADGVHSSIRDQAFARTGARSALLAQSSWRFMAPNPGVDFWTLWTSAECMVLLAPVGDHSVYG